MDKQEIFRKKFRGSLNKQEQAWYQQQMATNRAIEKEYLEYETIATAVILGENAKLKEQLQQLEVKPQRKSFVYWPKIAAVVIVFFGISFLVYVNTQKSVYQTYFEPYPNVHMPNTRSANSSQDQLTQAFRQYEAGNYQTAINGFTNYVKQSPNANISFYLAMAYANTGNKAKAKPLLQNLLNHSKGFLYVQETRWYLALIYVEEKHYTKAKELLLANHALNNTFKLQDTKAILARIEKKL